MLRLGWLSTGRGEGSRGFLELVQSQIDSGELNATIEFVFSNREHGEAEGSDRFFRLVESHNIPLVTLSSARYRLEHGGGSMANHRKSYHREVMGLISGFNLNLCVLAGYMLITSAEMCQRYMMINLHPALPDGPIGTWRQVIWELIDQRASESGVMVHVATEIVDSGPVLTYCSFPIYGEAFDPLWSGVAGQSIAELKAEGEHQSLFRQIRCEGMRRERPLLLETLKALADDRIRVFERRIVNANDVEHPLICLNQEVDRFLESSET